MLLYLSVELLQEIGGQLCDTSHPCSSVSLRPFSQLAGPDQKSLRQICNGVSFAIEPLFFSYLVLNKDKLRIDMGRDFLEALTTGETGWSPYAKTLHMKPAKPAEERKGVGLNRSETVMQELLASTLGSLNNVRTVM
ncbi:hypothetical protein C8R44DRAFT_746597 [Mycena epipterygia]|nr:hypothetical protein C8R44DRAFT_746597 [Mycena epipterygia]